MPGYVFSSVVVNPDGSTTVAGFNANGSTFGWTNPAPAAAPIAPAAIPISTGVSPMETSYSLYGHVVPMSVFGKGRIGGEIISGPWVENGLASFIISLGVPADPTGTRDLREIAFDSEVVWSTSGASGVTTSAGGTFSTEAFTFRFYQGTLTQAADTLESTHFGANAVAYRPQILLAFSNLPIANTKFKKIPYVSAVIGDGTGDDVNLGEAFERLAYSPFVRLTSAQFETSGVTDGLVGGGLIIAQDYEFLQLIQQFSRFYQSWDILQTDKLRIVDRGDTVTADITLNATRLMGNIALNRQGQDSVKKDLELSAIDPDADYTIVPSVAQFPRDPVAVTTSVGKESAYLPAIIDASTRISIVTLAKYNEEATRKTISGTAMAYGLEIEPGDLVAIRGLGTDFNNETFKVIETLHGANYSVEFTAKALMKCTADDADSDTTPTPPLAGLGAWYDTSVFDSLTLAGSTVTGVADLSGYGNDLVTAAGVSTPAPTYSATGFNSSYPTMIFTASAPSVNALAPIRRTPFTMGTGNTLTFFLVGTMSSSSQNNARAISYGTGGSHDYTNAGSWLFGRNASSAQTLFLRNGNQVNPAYTYNTPTVFIGTINSSGVMTLYTNGVASSTTTSAGNWVNNGIFGLGGGVYDFDSTWAGKISEVGISTSFTNSTDVATLYATLKAKWGL